MPLVAFCTDIQEFQRGRILEAAFAARFPGAAVIPTFAAAMNSQGWDVVTGDQILDPSEISDLDLSGVFVVQEENSQIGLELLKRGGIPALILSGESPLYARDFYRNVAGACRGFAHRVLFTGAHDSAGRDGINHPLLFPAFHTLDKKRLTPWFERRHLVILAGNKYWRHADVPWSERLRRSLNERRDRAYTTWLHENQLHDKRLELIAYFDARAKIDVYGSGWDRRGHLPATHRKALSDLHPTGLIIGYESKQELLSRYRFTLILENFTYPGYVTEKVFDALAAGSIPVYLGAPDIDAFIPREVFVDIREFSTREALERHLDTMNPAVASQMIEAGQNFLESDWGQRHTFENRGEFLASLVRSVEATQ